MVGVLTLRSRLALLIVATLAAISGVLVPGAVLQDEPLAASGAPAGTADGVRTLVAIPIRVSSMPVAVPAALAPLTISALAAAVRLRGCRDRFVPCLHARLGDVGDAWRALLLGAPPAFL